MKNIWKLSFVLGLLVLASCGSEQTVPQKTESPPPSSMQEQLIIAFGDSLTAGYQLTTEAGYPAQLEKKLHDEDFTNYKVLNMGVSGDTTAGGLRRVDWAVDQNPQIVILELGANDGLRGTSVVDAKKNLTEIIRRFQEKNIQVILAGMKLPPNLGTEYVSSFERMYPDLAKEYEIPLIPFFLEGVATKADLNLGDELHPNEAGYKIVTENVWNYLAPLLNKKVNP